MFLRVILALISLVIVARIVAPFAAGPNHAFTEFKKADHSDKTVLILGDSTSAIMERNLFRLFVTIALDHPEYTTSFRWFGSVDFDTNTAVLGSGKKSLTVHNASKSGARISDWTGDLFKVVKEIEPNLIIINTGLNSAALSREDIRKEYRASFSAIRGRWPEIPIILHLQQPMRDSDKMQDVIDVQTEMSKEFDNITILDNYRPILDAGKPASFYQDDAHLNILGDQFTLDRWVETWRDN